jgi:hypothetical protein
VGRGPLPDLETPRLCPPAAAGRGAFAADHPQGLRAVSERPAHARGRWWRDAVDTLVNLQADYATWLESLPPSLEQSATAEVLRTICDLDLTELAAVELPRGYGRD